MSKYHKINSLYKRDERGNFLDKFSRPEFGFLAQNIWEWTEKVDGTNIRIIWGWDGISEDYKNTIEYRGRTDKAQIPKHLEDYLKKTLSLELFNSTFDVPEAERSIVLYGEGYGHKIQKGGKYLGGEVGFVLFDAVIDGVLLQRSDVGDVADLLGILDAPIVGRGTLAQAEDLVKTGFNSDWGEFEAEGLVLRPMVELKNRRGERVITKIKAKDYMVRR